MHSNHVYHENRSVYRLTITGGIPVLSAKSPFILCPVLQRVCVFTIDEEDGCEFTTRLSSSDPHRPLFYTELDARGFNILRQRLPGSHPLARKRGRREGRWQAS